VRCDSCAKVLTVDLILFASNSRPWNHVLVILRVRAGILSDGRK
jgi:hypothetical protein